MKFQEYLNESSLSRIWSFIENSDKSFGVISASRKMNSEEQNEDNYINLIKDIRGIGLGYIERRI